jgi:hypothetical protein
MSDSVPKFKSIKQSVTSNHSFTVDSRKRQLRLTSSFFTSVFVRPSEGSLVHRNKRLEVKLHALLYGDNAWAAAFREVKSGAEKYNEERNSKFISIIISDEAFK